MGRVVDPLVRDDGGIEPRLEPDDSTSESEPEPEALVTSEESEPSPGSESEPEPEHAASPRGSAVRERLLARAAALRPASPARQSGAVGARGLDELEPRAEPATSALDVELDLIGAGTTRPPAAPLIHHGKAQLSPNLVAVFGTLLGLSTVASIIALLIHLDPRKHDAPPAPIALPHPTTTSAPPVTPPEPPIVKRERKRIPGPWRIRDAQSDAALRIIEGEIGHLPFLRALTEKGVQSSQAYRALTALKPLRNLDKCDKSDRFTALVERGSGKLKAFEYSVSPEEIYQAREGDKGLLVAKRLDLAVLREQVKGAFVADGRDLATAAQRAAFEPALTKTLATALDGHMDLEELKRGDMVRVVAQEVTVLGEFARYAGIEALEVREAGAEGKPLRVYYFRGSKSRGYYDDRGRSPYEGGWRKPVKDAPITSRFNPRRLHPVLKKIMPHTGTDFGAPSGTPVGASSFGTVSYVGYAGPSGNLVKIDHAGGIETGYAHLSRFAEGLKVGDKVKRLQLIGYVGSTGRSTGPHLHFTAKKNGAFFDAETLNMDGLRVLPSEERAEFEQAKAKYDALLDSIPLPAPLPPLPAAPEAAPAGPLAEAEDDPALGDEPNEAAAAPAPAPAPNAPPGKTAAAAGGKAVYLTDQELLKLQPLADDDGEVEE